MTSRALCYSLFVSWLPHAAVAELDFAHEVLPVLKEHCAECHTNGKYKGSLSLDTREALLSSDAVVPGDSANSLFIEVLRAEDPDDRMPQKADPLSPEKIAVLAKWVDEGLPWEPGFSFREATWVAPIAPRKPELPPARVADENPVDRIARAYFSENKVRPPAAISDAVFLRRVHLDLVGLLPSPGELEEFEASNDKGKRGAKVAELLARDLDYADHWMSFWNDLLRNDYSGTGFIDGGRKQITGWLYAALRDNKPYDQFVRELMSPSPESEGFIRGIKWRGNVNASQVQEVQYAQNVSQVFFGENLKCASCHDSFINDWKLTDAYGMAAITSDKPLEMFRCDKATGETAEAKFLFDELGAIDPSAPRAEKLKQAAALATSKGNGRLARTVVNRLWARLMGRGLVEPVDIMGDRPWSEDMLDFLAWDLAENGYDLKRTLALVCNSRTYQSATVAPPGEAETYVFQGPIAKRMTAEQFIDAVWELTGTAPGKIDAAVERSATGTPPPGDGAEGGACAMWIWSGAGARPGGETVAFTRSFELPEDFSDASLVITADNEYQVSINGEEVGADGNWETVERYAVTDLLRAGENTIKVKATNGASSPNPAGLFAHLRVGAGERVIDIATGEGWLAGGRKAVTLDGSVWAGRVADSLRGAFEIPADQPGPTTRASLVKATLLMRALGRPNREQVVTTRPSELTTLQALELNNGVEFIGYIDGGASGWSNAFAGRPDELIDTLYLSALSRRPGEMERSIGRELLGGEMTKEGVADLLWTVLMLPEFQFVR